ncbi:MAG: helix-turn-helix domain-containing protein [Clostridia bacterium]|jgi:repressor LexA|nr:helix-turn-helix domain-containing protein [Clostridia bacterium]
MNKIKEFRKQAHLSQLELAELCGVHQTAVSQWEQGRTNPDTDTLVALAHIFHTSLGSILGLDTPDDPVMVAVKGFVRAGEMTFIEDEDVCEFAAISPELARRGEYCALKVRGSSMYPMFQDGDTVIVRMQNTAEDNDIVVALEGRENATLKRLKIQKNGILLMAENPEYESLFYTKEQVARLPVTFFGKAVEIRREIH